MSRYFIYLVLVNLLINTIVYLPKILMKERFDGAIAALLIAIPAGTLLAYALSKAMSKFPGSGLSDIMNERNVPRFLSIPILLFLGIVWVMPGILALSAFSTIASRFINPDIPKSIFLLVSLAVVCWSATRSTQGVLNMLEISIVLSLPFIALITIQALQTEMLDWDAIRSMSDYVFRPPSYESISVSTYMFSGYLNLVVVNRYLRVNRFRFRWIIPIAGIAVLSTTFLIPIGLHGTQAVEHYIYLWVSTADSLRMKFGFVERVLYLFLFLYIGLAHIFATLVWNVGLSLLRDSLPDKLRSGKLSRHVVEGLFIACLFVATLAVGTMYSEKEMMQTVLMWNQLRLPIELALVAFVVFLAWRKKHA